MANGIDVATREIDREGDDAFVRFWEVYDAHYDQISARLSESACAEPMLAAIFSGTSDAQRTAEANRSRALFRAAVLDGRWQPYVEDLKAQGRTYGRAGIEYAAWFTLMTALRREMSPLIRSAYANDADGIASAFMGLSAVMELTMSAIGQASLDEKTRIISEQQDAIQMLSTPVLQLEDHVLILPIVGVLDTFRARHLTEQLLNRIRDTRALVVVIDVTGVVAVDTRVANHLIQAMHAATLMGTGSILTGVSPEVAQTLVALGVDLAPMRTSTDLQGGIELARRTVENTRAGRAPQSGAGPGARS